MTSSRPKIYPLDVKTVRKIRKSDAKIAWEIIKNEVASHVLGKNMVPVPYIHDAGRYELNAVVMMKRKNILEKMFGMKTKAVAVNILPEMIRSDISSIDSLRFTRPLKVNTRFHRQIALFGYTGHKSVVLQMTGLSLYQLQRPPNDGDAMIDLTPYFREFNTRSAYLVTKVVYTNELRLRVVVGNKLDEYRTRQRIPIGFQLTKFRMFYNAIIGDYEYVDDPPVFKWAQFDKLKAHIHRTLLVDRENRGSGDDGQRSDGPRNIRHRSIYRHFNENSDDEDFDTDEEI